MKSKRKPRITMPAAGTEMRCQPGEQEVRTLFVSDVHLGCRYAQPENFLAFIERYRPEHLYIVGDFLDGWKLSSTWTWRPVYTQIVNRLLSLAHNGTALYYAPGNHDAFLRCAEVRRILAWTGIDLAVQDEFIFKALNGRRFLVTHGDKFDVIEMNYRWLSMATSVVYEPLLTFNWYLSKVLRRPNRSPYALCAFVKDKVKAVVRFMSSFEKRLYSHAARRGCNGIICGHIHSPAVNESDSVTYLNTGDWVENCTALVECYDGTINLESHFAAIADRRLSYPATGDDCTARLKFDVPQRPEGTFEEAWDVALVG